MGPSSPCAFVGTSHVNCHHPVPIRVSRFFKADLSQYPSIVDQHVDAAKIVDGRLDYFLAILYAIVIGNGLSASCFDFMDNCIGRLSILVVVACALTRENLQQRLTWVP